MINVKNLDRVKILKAITVQIDHVTCLECCKYFISPATATCGHTLCHTCWRGRRTCPACTTQLERKHLRLNLPLQEFTAHVLTLVENVEKLLNIKIDEFNLDTSEIESVKDPNKNVNEWLTSSQNHFSAPVQNSESQSQEIHQPPNPLEVSASNIIIHSDNKKTVSPKEVVHVHVPQDDWDQIEPMPEPEDNKKRSEHIVGPMDIEPFYVDDNEYTTDNPRRSSRKRDIISKNDNSNSKSLDLSFNTHNSREIRSETDKQIHKTKNTWNNVKRMRKEFSKLNKKNRSKLNVSIEMAKKTQNVKTVTPNTLLVKKQIYNIDENTPVDTNVNDIDDNLKNLNDNSSIPNPGDKFTKNLSQKSDDKPKMIGENHNIEDAKTIPGSKCKPDAKNKITFSKRSALDPGIKEDQTLLMVPDHNIQPLPSENSDDIQITIKIGSTITNILIKKKTNDVQVKVNTDQEVQTTSPASSLVQTNINPENHSKNIEINVGDSGNQKDVVINNIKSQDLPNLVKSTSIKKNTASADTATVQFEITESVEKELSNEMELEAVATNPPVQVKDNQVQRELTNVGEHQESNDDLNDLDIFNSGSVKEANVQLLKEPAHSEILISTIHSKFRTQKKREREDDDELLSHQSKKMKKTNSKQNTDKTTLPDSEPINYDSFMGHVFASIDADIEDIKKSQEVQNSQSKKLTQKERNNKNESKIPSQLLKTQTINKNTSLKNPVNAGVTPGVNEYCDQKHSENVFSVLEHEDELIDIRNTDKIPQQVEELLTPVLCRNLEVSQESHDGIDRTSKPRRKTEESDSEKSVVEETPQKDIPFAKLKRTSAANDSQLSLSSTKKATRRPESKSIISLTDTGIELNNSNRNNTVVDKEMSIDMAKRITVDTPLTITKFTNHITHNSTPVARKSLHFDNENDDPEQTLCPTTQEREFINKVFEKTPTTPVGRQMGRNLCLKNNKTYCLAGSCLRPTETMRVKILCNERKWRYVEKYTPDLTHLVVGVDEEKKSQRSVKYMCALAASKWIVSFEWVEKCLQKKEIVDEEFFEALDSTGEPGPRRARLSTKKLFQGIMFYCMPPYSILDVDTLKIVHVTQQISHVYMATRSPASNVQSMLVAAGGRVVEEAYDVRITEDHYQPALLLAEPEHTQEDRFIFLAMDQSIVPVNYEWVLNCLGSYSLCSVQELLLCPSTLLPAATAKWPEVLIGQED